MKICTYFPYPARVWVNGHEWSKRRAQRAGIAFEALSNGFRSCAQPDRLQAICDSLGPLPQKHPVPVRPGVGLHVDEELLEEESERCLEGRRIQAVVGEFRSQR